jgi:YidC/Oxa1 family membrane protein insertase
MNIFGSIYHELVFRPLLNLLQLLYNLTNDIGISIIILAISVNLLMWPLFIKTYLNSQKLKYLQPQLKAIQTKYKDNREQLLQEQIKFNRKHGISNGSFLVVILLQILIASGLYILTRNVSNGESINGLYEPIFKNTVANFDTQAFNFLDIGIMGKDFIIFPIVAAILSFVYGLYTQKLTPKLPELPKPKKVTKKEPGAFDPEEMQKMIGLQMMYGLPLVLFFVNLNFSIGLNIYLIMTNLLSLVRQVFVSNYYHSHISKFFDDIAKSDPEIADNIELITDGIVVNEAVATDIQKTKSVKVKKSSKSKKSSKKSSKKKK